MSNTVDDGEKQALAQRFAHRRQIVFLVLSGIFLGTLAMLNILGISRFLDLSFNFFGLDIPFSVAVGVLPYPVTFLCTDFISEFYGSKRANQVVWTGLLLNLWVVGVLWLGGTLPGFDAAAIDSTAVTNLVGFSELPDDQRQAIMTQMNRQPVFFEVQNLAFGAVTASMVAYLFAQFVDVKVFHWIKRKTRGRHLWLRNNGSTLISQLVDSIAVILITHFVAQALPINADEALWPQLIVFIFSGYLFKVAAALLDTIPFYWGSRHLSAYLGIDPKTVH